MLLNRGGPVGMPTEVGHSKNGAFKDLRGRVWEKARGWGCWQGSAYTISCASYLCLIYVVFQVAQGSLRKCHIHHTPVFNGVANRGDGNRVGLMGCHDASEKMVVWVSEIWRFLTWHLYLGKAWQVLNDQYH